jgi:hypothetical protein
VQHDNDEIKKCSKARKRPLYILEKLQQQSSLTDDEIKALRKDKQN